MPTAATSKPMKPMQDAPQPQPDAVDVLAFPASVAQQMFWYLELLQGEVTAFNVPLRFRLTGPLDVQLLERSLDTIIERHEALRTHFGEADGSLLQIVNPELTLQIPVVDISHLPADNINEEAERLGSIEARRPFRLSIGPLVRAEIVRLSADSHIFHLSFHHAIFDGMSMTVLTRELAEIYQAYFNGKTCPLAPLPIQFGDYSVWQKEFLEGPEMKQQLCYWKKQLEGMTELDLPTDFPRPPVKSWKGDITSTLLAKELTDQLHAIATKNGTTLFHLQLAAYMILLHRYTGSMDVAVGTPVTGRTHGELEPLIGVFINSLILRGNLSGNPEFQVFLKQIRETALDALENQELPFECLVRELRPDRDQSRNPLFQVNFNHHRSFAKTGTFGGVTLTPIPSRSPGTIFDLHFFMVERKEGWRASCDYSTDLFTKASADRMLGHFKNLLENIAKHPDNPIEELEILTESEIQQLRKWSQNPRDYPRDATIGELFLETATRFPHRAALVCENITITYQQLHAEASRLAIALINFGLKPGDFVVISAEPGLQMINAQLAIMIAGGCCTPIDPSYPTERFTMLLNECGARIALTTARHANVFPSTWNGKLHTLSAFDPTASPVDIPSVPLTSSHPSHLLFTSGSTGRPKGVLLPHRGIIRLVRNNDFIQISENDVFLQAAPTSFDASLLEIWGALLNGGSLVLMPNGPGLEDIAAAVREKGVTILWLTSGLFQLMIDEHVESLKGLRYLLAGGDVLSPSHVQIALDRLPDTTLINGYGPTENTTFTTCHAITRDDLARTSIPIGKPIANTTAFILDSHLRLLPVGIPGELFTGGDGLAIGYHDAPTLTTEKFIEHPGFGRLYRTGDRCRYAADGTIEFIGRNDHQVKVRGFRIELGEIETILSCHPQVRQCKVAVRGDSVETKRIIAWVVPTSVSPPSIKDLRSYLSISLPSFMQPDGIAVIEAFPLNANGKIQITSLPDPGHPATIIPDAPIQAPEGLVECQLATIWRELLGISEIGRNDDFFSLGGHSLMALRMFSRITREFGKSLPLATLLQHPTIASLAVLLEPQNLTDTSPLPGHSKVIRPKGNIVTLAKGRGENGLFCIHGGDGGVIFYRGLAALTPPELPIHAIESLELGNSGTIEVSSIEETAAAYIQNVLAFQPQGPFKLSGYSFGGVVAYEMACQLLELGHKVDFLCLFDTHNPAAPSRSYSYFERFNVFWRQSNDLSFFARIGLLRKRIREGFQTNRRIRAEIASARTSDAAPAYSDLRRIQVREVNWRAMSVYQPKPYNGRVTLFKTTFVNDKVERPADYGWSGNALSGLDIVSVSGHHLSLFAPEHIETLALALTRSLKRCQKSS
ncbi:MAG: amino acid adenylation domain-containing protein [Gloeobacteraceae cyanobacterium ES-bin-144]|nr:amino acid adenylation domain-containing protein [Verrucomicrobiales bacterium]